MRDARNAGTAEAIAAVTRNKNTAIVIVTGSVSEMPNNTPRSQCPPAAATTMPTAIPMTTVHSASLKTIRMMAAGSAPRDIRNPISDVFDVTVYASKPYVPKQARRSVTKPKNVEQSGENALLFDLQVAKFARRDLTEQGDPGIQLR